MNNLPMIHDDAHYTCGACAIPMTDDECVDVIDLHTHDSDVICHECAEQEWITDDFQIIPAHVFNTPVPVSMDTQAVVVEIRTEWDSVSDIVHGAEEAEYVDAEEAYEQELIE